MASKYNFKYNFIAEPADTLLCVICLEVAEEPRQHGKCGKLFCRRCLEKYGRDRACSTCRREQPEYFEDNKSNREIQALQVKCSNMERGCEWVGTVGTLERHVATCGFTLVPCPKRCKDTKSIGVLKKDLDKHLKTECPNRDHKCKYCGMKGTYATITEPHDKKCEKKTLPCPNTECGIFTQRWQVEEHLEECPYTVIPCKYKGIGCDTELKREAMAAHEQDDKLHLHMALDTVNSLQAMAEERVEVLKDKTITIVLPDYKKKKETNTVFQSLPFYTHPNGYHMSLRVDANGDGFEKGTHVSVFASILEGKYDAGLKWPFAGTVNVTLLNQLEDENHRTRNMIDSTDNIIVGGNLGFPRFIPHSELAQNGIQYLKNDTLYFRVEVEVDDLKPWLMN